MRVKKFASPMRVILPVLLVFIAGAVVAFGKNTAPFLPGSYSELQEINNKNLTFPELNKFFTRLADTKGAPYAFEVLKQAKLPENTDLHLLGHTIGDELFKQKGADGMTVCTQDFRNACSHSIVVGLFLRDGEKALEEIAAVCGRAPGGTGAYTMCFHGLGHGILAAFDYDLSKAASMCRKTGTQSHMLQEVGECIGGAVMEIISGGFHNIETWTKQRSKYLIAKDPLLPCSDEYVPPEGKYLCYTYLTPWLMEVAGFDPENPSEAVYQKAFTYCDAIPKTQVVYRTACFGGFGKEFVVLVPQRDIRAIEHLTDDQLGQIYHLCTLAPSSEGTVACINSAMNSLYWGGENGSNIPIRFCGRIPSGQFQTACYMNFIGSVYYYVSDAAARQQICRQLPGEYQTSCSQRGQ